MTHIIEVQHCSLHHTLREIQYELKASDTPCNEQSTHTLPYHLLFQLDDYVA